MLRAENISYRVGKKTLLHEAGLLFAAGRFHVVMGANGAGKSTLLKLLAGEIKPATGAVFLDDKNLSFLTKKELATRRAVLSQHYHLAFPLRAEEVVLMGRYPYFQSVPAAADHAIVAEAVKAMDVQHLLDRDYTTLSGGEAQKVQMSRVLAQISGNEGEGKLLFLDEPVSHLDVKFQYQLLAVAKALCAKGTTVIAVLHDLNLALCFADRLLLLKEGNVCYDFTDVSMLTADVVEAVFGLRPVEVQAVAGAKPFVRF